MDETFGNTKNNYDNVFIEQKIKSRVKSDSDTEYLINKIDGIIKGDEIYRAKKICYNFTKYSYVITENLIKHIDEINRNSKKVKVFIVGHDSDYDYDDYFFCFKFIPRSDCHILNNYEEYKITGWYARLEYDCLIIKLIAK